VVLISGLSGVTHSQDYDVTAVISVQHDIAAVSERHKPLSELGRLLVDRSTEFRVSAQDALANRADCQFAQLRGFSARGKHGDAQNASMLQVSR
jgi:hypothetical protein